MKYSVRTAGLYSCGEELEQAARRLRQELEELDTVIERLKPQWCMETLITHLRRERQKLEEQVQNTLAMAQAVRRCGRTYQSMENRVLEELDCPRHVLDGTGGQVSASYQPAAYVVTAAAAVKEASQEPVRPAEVGWNVSMAAYAAALAEVGVTVRLAGERKIAMAVSEIGIDTAALNRDVGNLARTLQQVRTEVEGMYESIRALDKMWDGPANEAFVQQFNIDYRNMQELCKAVQSLIDCMRNAGTAYTNSENQVASIVSAIRI